MDPLAVADQVREMGTTEFHDSNHAHEVLVNLHEIIEAAQETLHNVAEQVREAPGITDDYAEAADEAASSLSGVADELQGKIGGGIVQS